MADFELDVPVVAQETTNVCWHAAATMVWLYWQQQPDGRAGPMNTIAPTYDSNTALQATQFVTLARTVGLIEVPRQNTYKAADIVKRLKTYGPIWSAGQFGAQGNGHVIVVTGIYKGELMFNDPDGGEATVKPMSWFNSKLAKGIKGCLMAKDPQAY